MNREEREAKMREILSEAEPEFDGGFNINGDKNTMMVGSTIIINDSPFQPKRGVSEHTPHTKQKRTNRSLRRSIRIISLGFVVLVVPLLFSAKSTQQPDTTVIRPIAAIAVDRAPDIQPADVVIPTDPLIVAPYETCFEMHVGCAFFRAPRGVEPSNAMAPSRRQDI